MLEVLNPQRQRLVSLEDRLLKSYEVAKGQAKARAGSGALDLIFVSPGSSEYCVCLQVVLLSGLKTYNFCHILTGVQQKGNTNS